MRKGPIAATAAVALVAVIGIGGLAGNYPGQSTAQANQQSTETMPGWATNAIRGAQNAKNAATNEAIDNSGVKGAINQTLLDHSAEIAAKTGVSQSTVESTIDQMDIQDWSVTDVPSNAQAQSTNQFSYDGVTANVTTYTDPSVVSVNTMGQDVAFSVPVSAQPYVSYLNQI